MNEKSNTTKSQALATVSNDPESQRWVLLQRQCKAFMASGFLPTHIRDMSQAITIAWKGRELGIPPLQAFSSIGVIKGKPVLSAELMLALIHQRVKGAVVNFLTPVDKQNVECTVEMSRPGSRPAQFRFTMDDARLAGVQFKSEKGLPTAWAKFPAAMLRARAISAGARAVFPDAVMGCYTAEEIGGQVMEADVVDVLDEPKPELRVVEATPAAALPPKDSPDMGWRPTDAQIRRFWALAKEAECSEAEARSLIKQVVGTEHLSELTQSRDYDRACAIFEDIIENNNSVAMGVYGDEDMGP